MSRKVGLYMFLFGIVLSALLGVILFIVFSFGNEAAFDLKYVICALSPLALSVFGYFLTTK